MFPSLSEKNRKTIQRSEIHLNNRTILEQTIPTKAGKRISSEEILTTSTDLAIEFHSRFIWRANG